MSVLSRSVTAAQRGRSFAGTPAYGTEEGVPPAGDTCRCLTDSEAPGSFGKPAGAAERRRPASPYAPSTAVDSGAGGRPGTVTVLYPVNPSAAPFPRSSQVPGSGRRTGRLRNSFADREAGMATAEYAIATLAAVAFAGLLAAVLGSGDVRSLLMGLIRSALTLG